jgi:hypothetical protein
MRHCKPATRREQDRRDIVLPTDWRRLPMSDYRRNRVPGGTYFFTVNLLDRDSGLFTDRIDALRKAVRDTRPRAPFHIDGMRGPAGAHALRMDAAAGRPAAAGAWRCAYAPYACWEGDSAIPL